MKTALLIIDVQKGLCCGPWAAFDIDPIIGRINTVVAKARAAGALVIFIQHEEDEGPLQFGTEGWQLDERLAARTVDVRVRKTATDSYWQLRTQSDSDCCRRVARRGLTRGNKIAKHPRHPQLLEKP